MYRRSRVDEVGDCNLQRRSCYHTQTVLGLVEEVMHNRRDCKFLGAPVCITCSPLYFQVVPGTGFDLYKHRDTQ